MFFFKCMPNLAARKSLYPMSNPIPKLGPIIQKIIRWSNIESKIDAKQRNKTVELIPIMTGASSNV